MMLGAKAYHRLITRIDAMAGFVCWGARTGRDPRRLKSRDNNLSVKWFDLAYLPGFNLVGTVQFLKSSKILIEVFVPLSSLTPTILLADDKVRCSPGM